MRQINIHRNPDGSVSYDEVWIDMTQNVFFTNLDPQEAHWPYVNPQAKSPDFCANQLGPAPSPNSSQCPVPPPADHPPYEVNYGCKFHPDENGTIHVFPRMAVPTHLAQANNQLPAATVNLQLPDAVQVVVGGKSPYGISGQMFQVTDKNGNVIDSGSGNIGPNLQLIPDQFANNGISVSGTPIVSGTYAFTFVVDDDMGGNLQQVQYSMKVS